MFRKLFVGLVIGFAATAANAQVLDCAIEAGASQNGFITDRYIFEVDEASGTATVIDGVIQHETGKPIPAKLSANEKKTGLSWSLKLVSTTGKSVRMMYRASYIKATKTMQISVVPGGGEYAGGFEARGTCK